MRPIVFLALLLVGTASGALQAQSPDSILDDAARYNWYVRVTDQTGRIAEGRYPRLLRDTVEISGVRLSLRETERIERRLRGRSAALIGGAIGGAAMGLLGHAFATGMCEGECGGSLYITMGSGAMGFALGTAVGALVSPGKVSWETVLLRP